METKIDPAYNSRIEYLWFAHPKPWSINIGEIKSINLKYGRIEVEFFVNRSDAMDTEFWDPENRRVMLEIRDSEGVPFMENWVPFVDAISKKGTMVLQEELP